MVFVKKKICLLKNVHPEAQILIFLENLYFGLKYKGLQGKQRAPLLRPGEGGPATHFCSERRTQAGAEPAEEAWLRGNQGAAQEQC